MLRVRHTTCARVVVPWGPMILCIMLYLLGRKDLIALFLVDQRTDSMKRKSRYYDNELFEKAR